MEQIHPRLFRGIEIRGDVEPGRFGRGVPLVFGRIRIEVVFIVQFERLMH